MTKTEAIAAMERGEKVRHECFLPDEYMECSKHGFIDETGREIDLSTFDLPYFLPTGWSIYHPETGALAD